MHQRHSFTSSFLRLFALVAGPLGLGLSPAFASPPTLTPTQPASLEIKVGSGDLTTKAGGSLTVKPSTLKFAPPELRTLKAQNRKRKVPAAPANFQKYMGNWEPWPSTKGKKNELIQFTPRTDEFKTLILGSFYRYWRPETLVVKTEDGTEKVKGEDFKFNPDWGQIANLDNRLGNPGEGRVDATIEVALPRLDLVQVGPDGTATVKQGESRLVCPVLPEADPNHVALAGIFIAPWRSAVNPHYEDNPAAVENATEYAITASEIFPIRPADPATPINASSLSRVTGKLKQGEPIKIAFMGDSITEGAEAPKWYVKELAYTKKDRTYRGRLVQALRRQFPDSKITPIAAYKGGVTVKFGEKVYDNKVAPKNPDLVVIAFGTNDADGGASGKPKNPPEAFKTDLTKIVEKAKGQNADVLLVTPYPVLPWLKNGMAERVPEYVKALKEIAEEQNVAMANVYEDYLNLDATGIPAYSTIHNWKNHPGTLGHLVYAKSIARVLFQAAGVSPQEQGEAFIASASNSSKPDEPAGPAKSAESKVQLTAAAEQPKKKTKPKPIEPPKRAEPFSLSNAEEATPPEGKFASQPTFEEYFDNPKWNPKRNSWEIARWKQNKTKMSPTRCAVNDDGMLVQTVLPRLPGAGGSIQTTREFGYGRWVARLKPSSVPGVLNSMFTKDWDDLNTPKPKNDGGGSEVDIEFLTKQFDGDKGKVHLAIHLRGYSPYWREYVPLDFNPSQDFYEWGFDILPDRVIWHVNGKKLGEWMYTEEHKVDPDYEFFFNSWTMAEWIKGPPKEEAIYEIDWVRFYPYEAP